MLFLYSLNRSCQDKVCKSTTTRISPYPLQEPCQLHLVQTLLLAITRLVIKAMPSTMERALLYMQRLCQAIYHMQ